MVELKQPVEDLNTCVRRNRPASHLAVRVEAVAERNVGPTVSV